MTFLLFVCVCQVLRTEGWTAFFSSLPPRLLSVVPMIGIQFATFEFLKSTLLRSKLLDTILCKRNPSSITSSPIIPTSCCIIEDRQQAEKVERNQVLRSPLWSSWRGGGGRGRESNKTYRPPSDHESNTCANGVRAIDKKRKSSAAVTTDVDADANDKHDNAERGDENRDKNPDPPSFVPIPPSASNPSCSVI